MATRLQHWDNLERAASVLLEAMERAARDPAWRDEDIERWDDLHSAIVDRPKLTVLERDELARHTGKDG